MKKNSIFVLLISFSLFLDISAKIGVASAKGFKHKKIEDLYQIKKKFCDNKNIFIGFFDGHCSDRAAKYAKKHLHNEIERLLVSKDLDQSKKIKLALELGFIGCDEKFDKKLKQDIPYYAGPTTFGTNATATIQISASDIAKFLGVKSKTAIAGTTASVIILGKRLISIGNVGNSRIILCNKDKTRHVLTQDHTLEQKEERRYIQNLIGEQFTNFESLFNDLKKITNEVVPTRSIGDIIIKRIYGTKEKNYEGLALPYTKTLKNIKKIEFLVLGPSSVWEEKTDTEIEDIVRQTLLQKNKKSNPAQEAAKTLLKACREKNKKDDMTVIVVQFK